jgi:methyl-accepting chemotaxis protein
MQRFAVTTSSDDIAFEPKLAAQDVNGAATELARHAALLRAVEAQPSPARSMLVQLAARLNGADRRGGLRLPFATQIDMMVDGMVVSTRSRDIGRGGMLIERPADLVSAHERAVILNVPGIGRIDGEVVSIAHETISVRFSGLADDGVIEQRIESALELLKRRNASELHDANMLADAVEAIFTRVVADGQISIDTLIGGVLLPRPDTEPRQYDHPAGAIFTSLLRPLLDAWLASRSAALHAAAIDQRGYVAAKTAPFRQPQRPGEPVLNHNLSLEAQIRRDPWAHAAARLSPDPVVQTRSRDCAPRFGVLLRTVSVPLKVGQRRWGALEIAYSAADDGLLTRAAGSAAPSPA